MKIRSKAGLWFLTKGRKILVISQSLAQVTAYKKRLERGIK